MPENETIATLDELHQRTRGISKGFVTAVDYFISSCDYPWDTLPPVVVARVAFDNFLVSMDVIKKCPT